MFFFIEEVIFGRGLASVPGASVVFDNETG